MPLKNSTIAPAIFLQYNKMKMLYYYFAFIDVLSKTLNGSISSAEDTLKYGVYLDTNVSKIH